MEEWMQEKRLQGWFKIMGGLTVAAGVYLGVMLFVRVKSTILLEVSEPKVFPLLIGVFSLSFILCGMIIFLLSQPAASEDKRAQLVIRLCSLYLFMVGGGVLYLGQRRFVVYTLLLLCAINLIGLCPLCNKSKKALFSSTDHQGHE